MTPPAGAVGEAPAGTLSRSEWAFAGLGVVLAVLLLVTGAYVDAAVEKLA